MNRKIPKSFKYWFLQDIEQHFGVVKVREGKPWSILNNWITTSYAILEEDKKQIVALKENLAQNISYWNEEELKIHFIGPLLRLVNIDNAKFRMFFDRQISAEYKNIKLTGIADMFIATGYQLPTKPYFFIHEFKPEIRLDTDPAGQLLAEMIAA